MQFSILIEMVLINYQARIVKKKFPLNIHKRLTCADVASKCLLVWAGLQLSFVVCLKLVAIQIHDSVVNPFRILQNGREEEPFMSMSPQPPSSPENDQVT